MTIREPQEARKVLSEAVVAEMEEAANRIPKDWNFRNGPVVYVPRLRPISYKAPDPTEIPSWEDSTFRFELAHITWQSHSPYPEPGPTALALLCNGLILDYKFTPPTSP